MQPKDFQIPANASNSNFINTLESTFSETLCIQDDQESEHAREGNYHCDVAELSLCGSLKQQDMEPKQKCLKKFASFPDPQMMLPPSSSDDEDAKANTSLTESLSVHSAHQTYSRSIYMPVSSRNCHVWMLFWSQDPEKFY